MPNAAHLEQASKESLVLKGVPESSVSANIICALVCFDISLNCTVPQFLFSHTCLLNLFLLSPMWVFSTIWVHMVFLRRDSLTFQISFSGLLSQSHSQLYACDEAFPASLSQVSQSQHLEFHHSQTSPKAQSRSWAAQAARWNWSLAAGLFVTKLFVQPFLVTYMDFDLFVKLWTQGDPSPFLVPFLLPVLM